MDDGKGGEKRGTNERTSIYSVPTKKPRDERKRRRRRRVALSWAIMLKFYLFSSALVRANYLSFLCRRVSVRLSVCRKDNYLFRNRSIKPLSYSDWLTDWLSELEWNVEATAAAAAAAAIIASASVQSVSCSKKGFKMRIWWSRWWSDSAGKKEDHFDDWDVFGRRRRRSRVVCLFDSSMQWWQKTSFVIN